MSFIVYVSSGALGLLLLILYIVGRRTFLKGYDRGDVRYAFRPGVWAAMIAIGIPGFIMFLGVLRVV